MKVMRIVLLLLISALPALSQSSSYPHLEFGIPKDSDSTDDYIIERPQYALSYNEHLGCPNWVSWNLESKYFGDVDRYKGKFITDTSLPTKFYHVKDDDYKNSGFDRGHIVRSEERTATIADNKATFILSNIVPQTHDLNAGPWLKLEYHCQKLSVDSTKELYIIAGGIFHSANTLNDKGKVFIPDSCFKIVVVMDKDKGLKDISAKTTVIAVIMPNIRGISKEKWIQYITTVDRIEGTTGYDFLDKIPDKIENILEAKKYQPPPEPDKKSKNLIIDY